MNSTAARLEIGPVDEGANKTDNNNDNDNDNRIIHAVPGIGEGHYFRATQVACPPARRTACGSGLGWLFSGGMPSSTPPPAYLCRLLGTVLANPVIYLAGKKKKQLLHRSAQRSHIEIANEKWQMAYSITTCVPVRPHHCPINTFRL
jgi:hypothetical protein